MSKPLAASKKVMKNYLSELLTDNTNLHENDFQETNVLEESLQNKNKHLEQLLQNVNAEIKVQEENFTTSKSKSLSENLPKKILKPKDSVVENKIDKLITRKSLGNVIAKMPKPYREGDFQALFFNVAGLTIAVPLIELGGIHNIEKTTSLIGKPEWYKGVMLHREEKIDVVDTALWVMPDKYDDKMKSSLKYQYVIMLSDSKWGLTAENLVDTITLKQDEVKWLDAPSKRPWLAGLVKNKMCALLDVEALILLLDEGSGINQDV